MIILTEMIWITVFKADFFIYKVLLISKQEHTYLKTQKLGYPQIFYMSRVYPCIFVPKGNGKGHNKF